MFSKHLESIASAAGNLFFLAAILLFVMLILMSTGTVRAQDALEPDALEPDALESDALEPGALAPDTLETGMLGPDALDLEPVDFQELLMQIGATDQTQYYYCYICRELVDPMLPASHRHLLVNPDRWPNWCWDRYDNPNEYWWRFAEDYFDENGLPRTADAPPPGGAVVPVPAEEAEEAEPGAERTMRSQSTAIPAVIESSPGRAQGRIK